MTSHEVVALLDGRISYRQLDWWIRTGRIQIDDQRHGSGHHRTFTPVEVAALLDYVDLHERVAELLALMANGTAYAQMLTRHRPHIVREVSA